MAILKEINEYLLHNDYSLANRRMLDAAYETQDDSIIQTAIDISRLKSGNETNAWRSALDTFLQQLDAFPFRTLTAQPLLTVNQIAKRYSHSSFALSPVSIAIQTGDIVGLVGENGNGKTTLLRCVAKELAVDTGTIQYHFIPKGDNYDIKTEVAFIPQRIPRWYGMLKDNLHFSAAIKGVVGKRNHLMVDFMLERFNITQYAHLTWDQISSGYRTRFEIARILLQSPKLLILDEPLANLDINAQQTILTDLRMLAKSSHLQMGIMFSSQQLHEVEKVADNVMFLKQGKCLVNTVELAEQKVYAAVIKLESKSTRDTLQLLLPNDEIKYNGSFYTIYSKDHTAADICRTLCNNHVEFDYFRNISHSTKQYFNA